MQNLNLTEQFEGWPPAALPCGRRLTLAYVSGRTIAIKGAWPEDCRRSS
jgi:hypothetical protein